MSVDCVFDFARRIGAPYLLRNGLGRAAATASRAPVSRGSTAAAPRCVPELWLQADRERNRMAPSLRFLAELTTMIAIAHTMNAVRKLCDPLATDMENSGGMKK